MWRSSHSTLGLPLRNDQSKSLAVSTFFGFAIRCNSHRYQKAEEKGVAGQFHGHFPRPRDKLDELFSVEIDHVSGSEVVPRLSPVV